MTQQPLIRASKSPRDPDINGTCLLLVNPSEASHGATIAKKRGGRLHPLFHSTLMSFKDNSSEQYWAGPCVGSPMAVMTVEKLIALGLKKLVVFGWCGSLSPEMQIGDLFLPEFGVSDEGVSRHYPLKEPPMASATMQKELQTLFPTSTKGPIWTTDAPFRELPTDIQQHAAQGIKAVDMEFTALCTVCQFYKVKMAGIMVVSDELYHDTWQSGIGSKAFKKKAKTTLNTLMDNLPL
jgi:purine-nucleoside phosphorylase